MTLRLAAIAFDAHDPVAQATFWGELLGRPVRRHDDGDASVLPDDNADVAQIRLDFLHTNEPKVVPLRGHFDLTSESEDDMRRLVEHALALGARRLDIGQGPDATHVVLADPEGHEFDVIPPGNRFLAGCGRVGCLASDGTAQVGRFWSAVLGWPLVWDQDEETAIQAPEGGMKISWGGPPVAPKPAKNRVHLDLTPTDGSDQAAEVARLIGLGARHIDIGQGEVSWVVLADPDGNEFCVLASG